MRVHFATVPIVDGAAEEEELNRFLASHRVLSVDRHLVDGAWAICVTYVSRGANGTPVKKGPSIDYREVLSPEDFAVFSNLRELRKELAQRDGIPAYAVFTNDQLAAMVQERVDNLEKLGKIPGVGAARVEKYGDTSLKAITKALRPHHGETKPR